VSEIGQCGLFSKSREYLCGLLKWTTVSAIQLAQLPFWNSIIHALKFSFQKPEDENMAEPDVAHH
jgi:hypothetical protein